MDAVCTVTGLRTADARLAVLVVVDAMAKILPAQELAELADVLPVELCLLLLQCCTVDDAEPLGDLALVDARTIDFVCRLVARDAPTSVQAWVARYVAPRLSGFGVGSRVALQSIGSDGLGLVTLPELRPVALASEPLRATG